MAKSLLCRIKDLENALKAQEDPQLVVDSENVCAVVGWVNVNSDGSVQAECGGVTASRDSLGIYSLTPPIAAESSVAYVLEPNPSRDSIEIHPTAVNDFLSTQVWIGEGDNGGTANTLRDRSFTVIWYGSKTIITGVTLT